jgi:hypothetical protein
MQSKRIQSQQYDVCRSSKNLQENKLHTKVSSDWILEMAEPSLQKPSQKTRYCQTNRFCEKIHQLKRKESIWIDKTHPRTILYHITNFHLFSPTHSPTYIGTKQKSIAIFSHPILYFLTVKIVRKYVSYINLKSTYTLNRFISHFLRRPF